MSFKTFDDVIAYMENDGSESTRPLGRNVREFRLQRMQIIMDRLGNPQNCYKTLHIAGSKGKGSTSSYLASALIALGYKTGLYLSPHVSDYRERFTVNGKFADDADLIATGNMLEEKLRGFSFAEELGESSPTAFELYTAFGFLLFKNTGCTWAVIETGLGGRLDATNILKPQASILTPIELEHTELLGDTIEKIAGEKSKIIKEKTPSFSSLQKPEATQVFRKEAKEKNSDFTELSEELTVLKTATENDRQVTHLEYRDGFKADLNLKMLGSVQAYNCALALCVLRKLGLYREGLTQRALEENKLPGRMEKTEWKRPLYLDGAHTENSIKFLIESFKNMYPSDDPVCIFGCLTGKNAEAMGKIILANFRTIIVSKPGTFKKSNPQELFSLLNTMKTDKNDIYLIEDAEEALSFCEKNTKPETPVLVCGSFYLAGEIKEALCH